MILTLAESSAMDSPVLRVVNRQANQQHETSHVESHTHFLARYHSRMRMTLLRDEGANVKYCPSCKECGIMTPVERYKAVPMQHCTFHYWLMRGRSGGTREYSLEEYANGSRLYTFIISLPSDEAMRTMQGHKPAPQPEQ